MALVNYTLDKLKGRTITDISFTLDDGGTKLDAFEYRQEGEVVLHMDGHDIAPLNEFDGAPVPLKDEPKDMIIPILDAAALRSLVERGAVFRDAAYEEPDALPDQAYYIVIIGRTPRLKVMTTPPRDEVGQFAPFDTDPQLSQSLLIGRTIVATAWPLLTLDDGTIVRADAIGAEIT